MPKPIAASLAAALTFAVLSPAWAQQEPMPTNPAAIANVHQSERYEQVIQSNPSFRAKRMQQECGPITDPQLHQSCVASFGEGAPPPRHH